MYLTAAFLLGLDYNYYGKILEDLHKKYIRGKVKYPKTLTNVYKLVNNWQENPRNYINLITSTQATMKWCLPKLTKQKTRSVSNQQPRKL